MMRVYLISIIEKKKVQKEKKKSFLRLKKKGKRIIISKSFTSIKKLYVFNFIPNHQNFQNKNQSFNNNQNLHHYYIELFEYNKNNYWDGDKIMDQIFNLTIRIFFIYLLTVKLFLYLIILKIILVLRKMLFQLKR